MGNVSIKVGEIHINDASPFLPFKNRPFRFKSPKYVFGAYNSEVQETGKYDGGQFDTLALEGDNNDFMDLDPKFSPEYVRVPGHLDNRDRKTIQAHFIITNNISFTNTIAHIVVTGFSIGSTEDLNSTQFMIDKIVIYRERVVDGQKSYFTNREVYNVLRSDAEALNKDMALTPSAALREVDMKRIYGGGVENVIDVRGMLGKFNLGLANALNNTPGGFTYRLISAIAESSSTDQPVYAVPVEERDAHMAALEESGEAPKELDERSIAEQAASEEVASPVTEETIETSSEIIHEAISRARDETVSFITRQLGRIVNGDLTFSLNSIFNILPDAGHDQKSLCVFTGTGGPRRDFTTSDTTPLDGENEYSSLAYGVMNAMQSTSDVYSLSKLWVEVRFCNGEQEYFDTTILSSETFSKKNIEKANVYKIVDRIETLILKDLNARGISDEEIVISATLDHDAIVVEINGVQFAIPTWASSYASPQKTTIDRRQEIADTTEELLDLIMQG